MDTKGNEFLKTGLRVALLWAAFGWGICLTGQEAPPLRTIIESERIEMRGEKDRNLFTFTENVQVIGNNLLIQCDHLEVEARRGGEAEAAVGEIGSIESVTARGSVVIEQAGRRAYCGRADFDPRADQVILSENPKVVDAEAEVRGWKIVIHTGKRQVEVLSNPDAELPQRATVLLDALPDFGFAEEERAKKEKPDAEGQEKSGAVNGE